MHTKLLHCRVSVTVNATSNFSADMYFIVILLWVLQYVESKELFLKIGMYEVYDNITLSSDYYSFSVDAKILLHTVNNCEECIGVYTRCFFSRNFRIS